MNFVIFFRKLRKFKKKGYFRKKCDFFKKNEKKPRKNLIKKRIFKVFEGIEGNTLRFERFEDFFNRIGVFWLESEGK